jgi:hypothetical protein
LNFNAFYFGISEGIFDGFTGAIYEAPLERSGELGWEINKGHRRTAEMDTGDFIGRYGL